MLVNKQILQVVKQTVMTVVYGITWVGGRQQIAVSLNLRSTSTVLEVGQSFIRSGNIIINGFPTVNLSYQIKQVSHSDSAPF